MMYHQKATQNAIAAMSRLAELYNQPGKVVSSREISESRGLPAPIVAKILTDLSRGGLVKGSPGPGGGYRLARPPSEIRLKDVVELFEREDATVCPFGPEWCGEGEPCPLHDSLSAMKRIADVYLSNTTFAVFQRGRPMEPRSTGSQRRDGKPSPSRKVRGRKAVGRKRK